MDYSKITVSEFIKMFPKSYIQTFDDQKERKDKSLTQLMPIKSVTIEQLQALNQRGAGIFFTPNPCKGGRKEENYANEEQFYQALVKRMEDDTTRYMKYYNIDAYDPNNFEVIVDTTNKPIPEVLRETIEKLKEKGIVFP